MSFPLATSLGSLGLCKMSLKPTDRSWGWAMLLSVIGPPSQTFDQHVTLYYEGSRNCPVLSGHCIWAECVCLCVCTCLHMHVHIYACVHVYRHGVESWCWGRAHISVLPGKRHQDTLVHSSVLPPLESKFFTWERGTVTPADKEETERERHLGKRREQAAGVQVCGGVGRDTAQQSIKLKSTTMGGDPATTTHPQ